MAYWCNLDDNNVVTAVILCDNNDPNGDEGYQWIMENLGGRWAKTSYNTRGNVHILGGTPFRKNFGEVGYTYDEVRDAFIPPMPEEGEWVLNEETCLWEEVTSTDQTTS